MAPVATPRDQGRSWSNTPHSTTDSKDAGRLRKPTRILVHFLRPLERALGAAYFQTARGLPDDEYLKILPAVLTTYTLP
jgi:hypothetical protein